MKIRQTIFILPPLVLIVWGVVFFSTGYDYDLESAKQYIGASDEEIGYVPFATTSPECIAMRKQADRLAAPLREQNNKIAHTLIYDPLPIENGSKLHQQSVELEERITEIYSKYHCDG